MDEIFTTLILTTAAGSCIPLGAHLARFERIHAGWMEQEHRHFVIALGGGVLVGAIAFVLVPVGVASMNHSLLAVPVLLLGGVTFFLVEGALGLYRREVPEVMVLVLDYVPEAMALGGLIALGSPSMTLLALLIGLQNLPEGFNAFRELHVDKDRSARRTLQILWTIMLIGPAAGLIGYFFLTDRPGTVGAIMLFSSGGILYLIFQDIAPQSRLKRRWAPPVGGVVGFGIALLSQMLVGAM